MSEDEDDPLRHADVGETIHVERDVDLEYLDPPWDAFVGRDRMGDYDITDVVLVENEDRENHVRVTWEGDLTKTLPPRWDQFNEPRTTEEERRSKWFRIGRHIIPTAITGAVAVITWSVMQPVFSQMTVNGEQLTGPSLWPVVGFFVFVGLLATILPNLTSMEAL